MSEALSTQGEYKSALRLALSDLYPEQALCRWFDPLHVACDISACRLVITWPHHLFGAWVTHENVAKLEQAVNRICGASWRLDFQNPSVEGLPPEQWHTIQPWQTYRQLQHSGSAPGLPFGVYTLEAYLVNAKNHFPLTVLRETASGKLTANPLVLYGDAGSGKTHLARALGNALSAIYETYNVFYGSADEVEAILASLDQREAMRRLFAYKALIVDDIQRLPFLPHLNEAMTALIDHCIEHNKIFVCTTCLPPSDWEKLPSRIGTRLEQGLVMLLHTADMDIRLRYVQQQNKLLNLNLGRAQLLTLAQQCTGFRRLIGIVQRLNALKDVFGQDISSQDMDRVLMHTADAGSVTPQQVIRLVAARCNVRAEDITSEKRHPRIAKARQMAMFLCRSLLHSSYPAIGRLFGDRDHSTVIHSIKKMQRLWDTDKDMHTTLTELSLACRQNIK